MSTTFRDMVLAMAAEKPNMRAATLVALVTAIENATPGDLSDPIALGRWARRQPQIAGELAAGRKIQAIKELRAATQCSLIQAKDAVEAKP